MTYDLLLIIFLLNYTRSARAVKSVSIDPPSGAIKYEDSAKCMLSFLPKTRMNLVGCELLLKVYLPVILMF